MESNKCILQFQLKAFDDPVEYEDEAGSSPVNSSNLNHQGLEEVANSDSGDDSIKSEDNEILREQDEDEVEEEEEEEEESPDDGDEDDVESNSWNDFVAHLDSEKVSPNIDAYIQAKANRTEATTRFAEAAEACLEELYNVSDSMSSDIVETICTNYSRNLDDEEEHIIETTIIIW